MDIKVSIIVPCYKVERQLDRCVGSLVAQTLRDIEIILVDDGSPDNTPQMCDEWAANDKRIRVIHKSNQGIGFARNDGLEIAQGKYVAFVDSDDYIDKDAYRFSYTEAEKQNADAVYFWACRQYPNGKTTNPTLKKYKHWMGGKIREYILDIIACAPHIKPERYYGMSCWHSIYRKEIIKKNKIRFPTERSVASEDLPFQIDFLMNSERIIYLPNCFYHYCFKDGSFTTVFDKDYFDKLKKLHSMLKSKLGDETVCLQRIDRFFIGFVRTYLLKLVGSKTKEKQEAIKSVVNDKIWQEIKQRYSPSWLPIYQNICLRLIYRKDVIALLWYLKTIIWVKRLNQICISIK